MAVDNVWKISFLESENKAQTLDVAKITSYNYEALFSISWNVLHMGIQDIQFFLIFIDVMQVQFWDQ